MLNIYNLMLVKFLTRSVLRVCAFSADILAMLMRDDKMKDSTQILTPNDEPRQHSHRTRPVHFYHGTCSDYVSRSLRSKRISRIFNDVTGEYLYVVSVLEKRKRDPAV